MADASAKPYQIVSAVSLSIATPGQVSVGRPLSCSMSIDCSSRWAGIARSLEGVRMGYELLVDVNDWLVSGRKQGSFLVSVSRHHRSYIGILHF